MPHPAGFSVYRNRTGSIGLRTCSGKRCKPQPSTLSVPYQPLKNYLRSVRRRAGFSQDEIALLLGTRSGTKISRYETFSRVPPVSTVFAYEILFRESASHLFAGVYRDVRRAVVRRAKLLIKKLPEVSEGDNPHSRRKLQFLRSIVEDQQSQGSLT